VGSGSFILHFQRIQFIFIFSSAFLDILKTVSYFFVSAFFHSDATNRIACCHFGLGAGKLVDTGRVLT